MHLYHVILYSTYTEICRYRIPHYLCHIVQVCHLTHLGRKFLIHGFVRPPHADEFIFLSSLSHSNVLVVSCFLFFFPSLFSHKSFVIKSQAPPASRPLTPKSLTPPNHSHPKSLTPLSHLPQSLHIIRRHLTRCQASWGTRPCRCCLMPVCEMQAVTPGVAARHRWIARRRSPQPSRTTWRSKMCV